MTSTQDTSQEEEIIDVENQNSNGENLENLQDGADFEENSGENQNEAIQENDGQTNSSQVSKLTDQLARLTADHQNYVRRAEQEKGEMGNFFTEKFAKKVLPTVDNLERVLTATPKEQQNGSVFDGVKGALAGLTKELESLGITSYSSVGQELDPNLHEALSQAPGAAGVIVMEFEKGYMLGKKVIRHAKVIVGNGDEM